MIKGIIFDCFGVLYEGTLSYLAGLARVENREAIYDVSRGFDYGYMTHDEYVLRMAELTDTSPEEIKRIGRDHHVRNEPLMDFARSLRGEYKTALLSNIGHSVLGTLFTPEELTTLFDVVVTSSDVGTIKPYPEIYELTASRLGLRAEECIMIDDSVRNVEGAEMTGMKGLLYSSTEQIKADVRRLLEVEGLDA